MKEVDITSIFNELKRGNKSSLEKSNMLQELIEKIEQRTEELANMKQTESDFNKSEIIDLDAA